MKSVSSTTVRSSLALSVSLSLLLPLGGCGSMAGLMDSNSSFACKAPDGVACTSVSGVYANAQQGNLPALQSYRKSSLPTIATSAAGPSASAMPVALPGMPIRSQARVLRVWVAPWIDEDGALHDQNFIYLVVDPGKWQVEHSREATVRRTMARLRPLGRADADTATAPGPGTKGPREAALQAAVVPGSRGEAK